MPPPKRHPVMPLYLFYGTQHEAILKARDEVVDMLLPSEFRNENLTNYYASGAKLISLGGMFGEIAGDLATLSFFPGAAKVGVVTNPAEIFASDGEVPEARPKRAKGDDSVVAHWLEHELPQSGNHLVLLGFEDESAGRFVQERKPNGLLKLILKLGHCAAFRDKAAMFKIEDALLQRDLNTLIGAIRGLWSDKTELTVFNKIAGTLRFCMQANIARERKLSASVAADGAGGLFPLQSQNNLFKAHDFVQKKYQAPLFRTADLVKAHQQLLEVYRAMRPRPGDVYVPDPLGMLEQILMELVRTPRPRA